MIRAGMVYWMRFGLAILSALICAFLRLNIEGLIVGIMIYLFSCIVFQYVIKTDVYFGQYWLYTMGIGTYFITWFTFWFLLNTLLRTN